MNTIIVYVMYYTTIELIVMSLLITVSLFFKQGFRRLWHLSVDWSFVDT